MNTHIHTDIRMLRMHEVTGRTALSRSCLYTQIALGLCPPFSRVTPRVCVLPERFLDAVLYSRMLLRDSMQSLRDRPKIPPWSEEMLELPAPRGIRLLHLREVLPRTGTSRSRFYEGIEQGLFPRPVPVTERARRWVEHEIDEALRRRIVVSLREIKARRPGLFPVGPSPDRSRARPGRVRPGSDSRRLADRARPVARGSAQNRTRRRR